MADLSCHFVASWDVDERDSRGEGNFFPDRSREILLTVHMHTLIIRNGKWYVRDACPEYPGFSGVILDQHYQRTNWVYAITLLY